MVHLIPGVSVTALIDETTASVMQHIRIAGDGVIPNGVATWQGIGGAFMKTWNTNNHQTTWGVLGAALGALKNYMSEHGWGAASFIIYDGVKEIGEGFVALAV